MSTRVTLGIETSCDETSVALVETSHPSHPSHPSQPLPPQRGERDFQEDGPYADMKHEMGARHTRTLDQLTSSQIEHHRPYGGVVPEVATRQHLSNLRVMTQTLLARYSGDIHGIGITRGPGLASSLLIGLSFGKALALARGLPWIGVNHLEGHLYSPFLAQNQLPTRPHIALIVSGGHTLLIHSHAPGSYTRLGSTLDDAAGEAFDKVAKMLGLPYPGGPHIEKHARNGDPAAIAFPRAMRDSGDFNFSFSGLKTSVRVHLSKHSSRVEDVCASFQQAIIDVLIHKSLKACREHRLDLLTLSGGVSCNATLRTALHEACEKEGIGFLPAPPDLSTDNAAMIATVAAPRLALGETSPWDCDIDPNLRLAS